MTILPENRSVDLNLCDGSKRQVIFQIENTLYRNFIELQTKDQQRKFQFIERHALAEAISEVSDGVLILQSDTDEFGLIEIAARLKRLFHDRLRIILLSADYKIASHADGVIDSFIQYPVSLKALLDVIDSKYEITRRVLLIDDSRLVHSTIVGPLKDAGYEVFQAYNGAEGVEMARAIRPRVIICDVEMPELNGFDACAAIRNSPGGGETHIIMSSSLGSAADQQRGFSVGVDEYITKPVVIEELIDRLDRALRRSNTGRENVLVLERDDTLARNIIKALIKHGFRPHHATSIRAGLRLLSRINCDLALVEIEPEDGSVIDFFKGLKTLKSECRPDTVILAARESHADTRMVINAGASSLISKPFSADKMLALIERTLADRRAQRERAQLQRYVSKASIRMALEKSILSGDTATTRADRKLATIFFSDIVNFTSRCERNTPQHIVQQVNKLFDVMTRIIMENNGDIDKFMGDACMAFWLDDGSFSTCEKSIDAMLKMRHALEEMNRCSPILSEEPISIRIGMNTGDVILCDIGAAEARIDLTIIGDSVNVASRLESASKQYGVDNLISEGTLSHTGSRYAARIIDRLKVKGKHDAISCFDVIDFSDRCDAKQFELIETFESGFCAYRDGLFEKALGLFKESERLEPVQIESQINPSRLYIRRCKKFISTPPQNWDGIWDMAVK